jgi:ABC-type uncharacterized transport system ATPase subunit
MAANVVLEACHNASIGNPEGSVIASLRSVTKKFGQQIALDCLSLNLRRGEVVALLGPNGAGKTTAVRLLLGLSQATSGEVRIFGGNPRDRASRLRLGAMLQVGRMPETLRVREHLQLFSSYYASPRPLDELLAIAGLEGLENRLFGTLSGGQKQRMLSLLLCAAIPTLSAWTNRHSVWMWRPGGRCGNKCASWLRWARPFCSRLITWRKRTRWPVESSSFKKAK